MSKPSFLLGFETNRNRVDIDLRDDRKLPYKFLVFERFSRIKWSVVILRDHDTQEPNQVSNAVRCCGFFRRVFVWFYA